MDREVGRNDKSSVATLSKLLRPPHTVSKMAVETKIIKLA